MTSINIGRVQPRHRGAWDSGIADYAPPDIVEHQGASYFARQAVPASTAPPNATYWGLIAARGDVGEDSAVPGPTGPGVPDGGTTGQVLAKASGTDQDTAWIAPPADGQGVPTGGAAGQVLEKVDGTDFNTQWAAPSGGGGLEFVQARAGVYAPADEVVFDALDAAKYGAYRIMFEGLRPTVDRRVELQFGTGAGPTWITTGYQWYLNRIVNGAHGVTSDMSDGAISIMTYNIESTGDGSSGVIDIMGAHLSGKKVRTLSSVISEINEGPDNIEHATGGGVCSTTSDITAIRLRLSGSGLLQAEGRAILYGYRVA